MKILKNLDKIQEDIPVKKGKPFILKTLTTSSTLLILPYITPSPFLEKLVISPPEEWI